MILVTAFDRNKQDIVSVGQYEPKYAAETALDLAQPGRYIRIMDGAWQVMFPASFPVSKARLAHIIEHRAEVEFA